MQNIFDKFPEILLVDATYKRLDLRMPLYLLFTIDGNEMSEIGAMFMISNETKAVIEPAVNIFKKYNPKWTDTNVIMSDKDFNEREAFTKLFTDASLGICFYHTLRSFSREITTEKMTITSAERNRCLELVRDIVYSKNSEDYVHNVEALKRTKF